MTTTTTDLGSFYADSVVDGLEVPTSTDLNATITAGAYYIDQELFTTIADPHLYTASKDTYVDIDGAGTFTYIVETLSDPAPALTADSIRLAKVVTDGTTVASVVDLRTMTDFTTFVFGEVALVGTGMELYNDHNMPIMIRFGSTSTAKGMPLDPYTSRTVDEVVYVKPVHTAGDLQITG